MHQPVRLVQIGRDRADHHHPVAGGLLEPETEQLGESAVEPAVLLVLHPASDT
jgi:hypothetical protein